MRTTPISKFSPISVTLGAQRSLPLGKKPTTAGAYNIYSCRVKTHVKFLEYTELKGYEWEQCMQHKGHDFLKRQLLAHLLPSSLPSHRQSPIGQP